MSLVGGDGGCQRRRKRSQAKNAEQNGGYKRPRGRKPNWAKGWDHLRGHWVDDTGSFAGSTSAPAKKSRKRKGSAAQGSTPPPANKSKKRKVSEAKPPNGFDLQFALQDYMCPITTALPVDPVMAKDGRVYERYAIEQWFQEKGEDKQAPSPMTNEIIDTDLIPAFMYRNTIEQLVKNKLLVGDEAETWARETAEWDSMPPELREHWNKANRGDVNSMLTIGCAYRDCTHNRRRDNKRALHWFNKSALLGSASGGACLAQCYLGGYGVKRCLVRGHVDLARAAMLGSEHAAICLGMHMGDGLFVSERDMNQARYWYSFSVDCTDKDATDALRTMRNEWLATHGCNYHG